MKRLHTIAGAGVLLAVLSACATTPDAQEAAPAPPPASSQAPPQAEEPDRQPARTPPQGGTEVAAPQIDATGLQQSYPLMAWTADGGSTLGVVAQEGGCGKASAEVTEQADAQVVVTLVETTPATSQMCTMDLRYPKLTVELEKPLGERKLVLKSEQRKS